MSDVVRVMDGEPSEEERALSVEKTRVELKTAYINLEKESTELAKVKHELKVAQLTEGFDMLHLKTARLSGGVDEETVGQARSELYTLSEMFPGERLTLDINSPGGSVSAGMELFGILRELSKSGHEIVTRISGEACSMGGVIAQAGDIRQIREGSYLHLHEASWGAIGKASEMRESADFVERITRDISKIYAKRSTWDAERIYDRMHRREWWLGAEEALEIAFVDEIV